VDPVDWLAHVADGSPLVLLFVVMLALFVDSLALIGALLPGDLLLLVPSAAVGLPEALLVVVGGAIGTVLGYTTSYLVGRRAGSAIRRSRLGRRVGDRRWMQAEQLLRGPAGRALVLVQFMPVLNYLVPLLAGTFNVPLRRFIRLIGLGAVAYSSLYMSLGVLAGGTGEAIGQSTGRLVGLLAVALTVAVLGVTVLSRAIRRMPGNPDDIERTGESDPGPAERVDGAARNVADSSPCTATAFSTGTGSRCP
jgi:membrane-associated protein